MDEKGPDLAHLPSRELHVIVRKGIKHIRSTRLRKEAPFITVKDKTPNILLIIRFTRRTRARRMEIISKKRRWMMHYGLSGLKIVSASIISKL